MNRVIKSLAALALVLGMFTACTVSTSDAGDAKVKDAKGQTAEPSDAESSYLPDTEVPEPEPAPDPKHHLVKSDVKVALRVKSKDCFGSAGCIVGVAVTMGWNIPNPGKLDGTYEVTYNLTGDEDGPQIDTLTVYPNGRYDVPYDATVSTPSTSTPMRAVVTRVTKVS